jgi:DNA-directed RNA polymerase subunit K/omega
MGSPVLIEIDDEAINDPIDLAIREFDMNAIPMTVKRGE